MSNLFSSGGAGNVGFSGETQQSLKFNDDESQYLSWTPASTGNLQTWTWSAWVKRGTLGVAQIMFGTQADGSNIGHISFQADDTIKVNNKASTTGDEAKTVMVFRDASAWYHIVIAFDGAQSTQADRTTFYVNGVEQSRTTVSSKSAGNGYINTAVQHTVGTRGQLLGAYFDGYLSDINFIDGQALDPTSFGETVDGYWKAKDYAGTYGTNGFRLTFQDDVVSEGFNAVTYTGTGVTNSVSGLGFSPDLVWIKGRNIAYNHRIYDTVRGVNKRLYSDLTNGEYTSTQSVMSFDADGFTLGTDAGENNGTTPGSFVAWCWDAGSGSPVSNTDGSITSSVKANPDYGFSVVSWTGNATSGATVGHGLSSTPEMIINKNRIDNAGWGVYHSALGATKYIWLQETAAAATYSAAWNDTSPTSSVFTVGNDGQFNGSSDGMISYCFNSVAGYSKISSYTGTGATGNSVTTGFRPAFLLYKRTDAGGNDWVIMDTTRSPSNPVEKRLFPNLSDAESASAGGGIDVTDTGFVINNTYANANASGGTYIYMAFADTREAAFWKDVSGQGNHWTPNNLDYRDSLIDSPANNFAVGNPLKSFNGGGGSAMVYAEGNLKLARPSGATGWASSYGSMSVSSGKWFWEAMCFQSGSADNVIGIHEANTSMYQIVGYSGDPTGYGYNKAGNKLNNSTGSAYGATYANGDVIGVALDMDAGTVAFYKNGASQGTAFTGLSGDFIAGFSSDNGNGAGFWIANFGQDSTFAGATTAGGNQDDNSVGDFKYAPPSGYLALCTANLPTPTIVDGSEYFNTVLYTGNGGTQSITGVNFQPSLTWIKSRSAAYNHVLIDSVRGVEKELISNNTNAEAQDAGKGLTSFDSDGFTVTLGTSTSYNNSSQTYASWNWKAGGTAVSNTDGSITSQVSVNVDAGFSVVSYTGTGSAGATVGHGLGVTPDLLIMRRRSPAEAWPVWVGGAGFSNTQYLRLNGTNAVDTATSLFNSTTPTSSVVTLGNGNFVNTSANNYIMYAFASVDGFSKVGSYTGNGSTDGPFVYTGFRPAWVMIKKSSASGTSWYLLDNKRDVYNVVENRLIAEGANAEGVGLDKVDFLSNGFKLRENASTTNHAATYIYLAFAENPFKYANAR